MYKKPIVQAQSLEMWLSALTGSLSCGNEESHDQSIGLLPLYEHGWCYFYYLDVSCGDP